MKQSRAAAGSKRQGRQSPRSTPQVLQPAPVPLKPRPAVFIGLLVAFVLWLAGLLVMYFATMGH